MIHPGDLDCCYYVVTVYFVYVLALNIFRTWDPFSSLQGCFEIPPKGH